MQDVANSSELNGIYTQISAFNFRDFKHFFQGN